MFFFFFKHKTAYEMRISDLISDVCSSDLAASAGPRKPISSTATASTPTCCAPTSSARAAAWCWPSAATRCWPARTWPKRTDTATSACSPSCPGCRAAASARRCWRSEEHTSELQSLMRISYAVFCLKKKKNKKQILKSIQTPMTISNHKLIVQLTKTHNIQNTKRTRMTYSTQNRLYHNNYI